MALPTGFHHTHESLFELVVEDCSSAAFDNVSVGFTSAKDADEAVSAAMNKHSAENAFGRDKGLLNLWLFIIEVVNVISVQSLFFEGAIS
ncbi:hypothetical protein [Enterovibrio baiacu]|uniref:hypothetical protein n=1 Tax=Enterovibrio baiacu TaxID=2491023 RepID=UPI003D0E909F